MRAANRWAIAILLLAAGPSVQFAAQGNTAPPVVVVGDIHGAFDAFRSILTHAGIIDSSDRWIAGNATFVQTGDFTDRGPGVRAAMDLLIALEERASKAGGRVAVLLGNHEVLNMLGEGQDVTPAIYATFADEQSEQRRQTAYEAYLKLCAARSAALQGAPDIYRPLSKSAWMAAHPPGLVEYRDAFAPKGRYGRWLRSKPAVLRLGDTVFLHAGINPDRAPRTLEDINRQVRDEIRRFDDYRSRMIDRKLILPFFSLSEVLAAAQVEVEASARAANSRIADDTPIMEDPLGLRGLLGIGGWSLVDPNGPLWFRGFATWTETVGESQMARLLRQYNVTRFVAGHTIQPTRRITTSFSGRVFLIDTGMLSSHAPGGVASALEIRDGRFTAIYADGRTTLAQAGEQTPR